jgi:glutamate/tyrosine decarboxylase-like PLP-dependent enzyme
MDELLRRTTDIAADYLADLPTRRVGSLADAATLVKALGGELPDGPTDPVTVIDELAAACESGLVASAGPRYFGFVIGGHLPASLAADWLTAVWDQNAGLYAAGPAAAVVEDVAAQWVLDLLGLPSTASVGFVTGATMANFTGLAAARHAVLARAGWDVEADGLIGAPPVRILAGAERHATVDVALRYLGFGTSTLELVDVDDNGAMRADALWQVLEQGADGPLIVCAQAGNVNTGAIDPLTEICRATHEYGGWVHVDGAFGLWAAATTSYRELISGVEHADSWATDAHKWLNVPYDSGLAIVADPDAHLSAMSVAASYLVAGASGERDAFNYTPESSRRARGFCFYAAVRSLGRSGVADLVDRCCSMATRFAVALAEHPRIEILNDVSLNQVLVRFDDSDEMTREVIARVQQDGTAWLGGTTWRGRAAMRISVSNWSTTDEDVDRTVAAILDCYRAVG